MTIATEIVPEPDQFDFPRYWFHTARFLRKILMLSAVYQVLIGVIFFYLPILFATALNGMEVLYPIISIPQMPWFTGIGIGIMTISVIQWIFGVILPKIFHLKSGRVLSGLFGGFMCCFFPFGTFFGITLLCGVFKQPEVPNKEITSNEIHTLNRRTIIDNIIASGLLMLHQPLLLILAHFFFNSLPLGMAHPILEWRVMLLPDLTQNMS
jgi:hypothetical protein